MTAVGHTVAIMQPYFCPYVGYFQLIAAADTFVIYDDVQFTKKGWINRNRLLQGGGDALFTIPVKAASDFLDVRERELAPDFDRRRLLNRVREAYRRAPQFAAVFPLVESVVQHPDPNLFGYILHSVRQVCGYLGLRTPLRVSSTVPIAPGLKGRDRVVATCQALGATRYLNAIGGTALYDREDFRAAGLDLRFLRPRLVEYPQLGEPFVPWLSIIDVLMFNPVDEARRVVEHEYELT